MTEWEAGADVSALRDLQWHWGETYQITGSGDRWLARRPDNGRLLVAAAPQELRDLIVADYTAQPVPRDCDRVPA